jgi:transposase
MGTDEATRYAEFCQFKQQVRGSDSHLIVGIDVAKDRHHAFFGMPTGRTLLRRLIFENNHDGFEKLTARADQLMRQNGLSKVVYAVEPTGNYHKPLAHWLQSHDQMLVLVSNKAIAENRQTLDGRWDKNDTKDSANVADLVCQGKCQFFEKPEPDIVTLRSLLALRRQLKKDEHALRMQIRNGLIVKYFPEFDALWGSCLEENLRLVGECLSPRQIIDMGFDAFVDTVTSKDRGERQLQRLKKIYAAARVSVGCPMDEEACFEAKMVAERMKNLRRKVKETEAHIEAVCRRFKWYHLLLTIPGFGPVVVACVLGCIGDPHRFKGRKQVTRLAGLDLNAKRSGKRSDSAVAVISKRGNTSLRYSLYQASVIATIHDEYFRELFTRYLSGREKERGIKTKMRVKLAAKMLVIAWTMMKNETAFNPEFLEANMA